MSQDFATPSPTLAAGTTHVGFTVERAEPLPEISGCAYVMRHDATGRRVVQVGNYLGYVLDEAVRLGFERILLCGHPGKLLKVAAGTFSTHNRTGDGRLEALCTHAALAGCGTDVVRQLYASSTTEQAMEVLRERELDFLWSRLAEAAAKRCRDRAFNDIAVETAFIDKDSHILGSSSGAASFAEELRHGQ